MTVNLSALAGAGQQFFDNNGNPLSGGKLWSYAAGTTTPQTTYTTFAGNVAHTNPIVLDSAGRVSTGEIWLTAGQNYKFVLMTSTNVPLATWDNITGINGTGIATNAEFVTYDPPFTGGVATTVEDKLAQTVSVTDFGVVGDGVTDDTLAMLDAWDYCRTNNKTLLISGSIRIVAATAAGSMHSTFYVYASSMLAINEAELLVEGKIGFDLTGVDRTLVQGFKVTTTGREMTENEQNNSSPALFYTGSGSKTSAVYRDLIIDNTVTNLTGAYRAGAAIRDYGCGSLMVDNVVAHNTILTFGGFSSSNVSVRNVYGYNIETNVYLNSCQDIQITNAHHINDVTQRDYWVGRTGSPARVVNGMNNVLIEDGSNCTVIGLHTVFAHERACYIQASQIHLSDCFTLNCDAYKLVGSSYTDQVKDLYVNNCHSVLDADWSATRGRDNNLLVTTYWASNLNVQNCSIRNDVYGRNCIQAVLSVGRSDGSTVENVYIRNVTGINAVRFVYSFLTTLTTAQLAALTPPGSFVSIRNVVIEDCFIKEDDFRSVGSLFEIRDAGASADALLNYAAENLEMRNNTIELPATAANRDDWIFDVRWVNGAVSENNTVDLPFANNGFFSSAVTQPYANLRINEPYLKHSSNVGALITALGNLSVLAGSTIKFSYTDGVQQENVEAAAPVTGTFLGQRVVAEIFGKGYSSVATTRDFGLEMNAKGDFYFGKMIGGVKTDQVSTPPVALTVSGTGVEIRGDLQPTVYYYLQMTLV